jgi:hypothetical protein
MLHITVNTIHTTLHNTGPLTVRDETGRSCGTLKVSVKWRRPLRPGGRHLGPNALTATETELLISRFSKQKDGQVRRGCTYFNSSNIGVTI